MNIKTISYFVKKIKTVINKMKKFLNYKYKFRDDIYFMYFNLGNGFTWKM